MTFSEEDARRIVSPLQRKLMRNALGLEYAKRPYRNRYFIHPDGASFAQWRDLCAKGFAVEYEQSHIRGVCFSVTDEGMAAIGVTDSRDLEDGERFSHLSQKDSSNG